MNLDDVLWFTEAGTYLIPADEGEVRRLARGRRFLMVVDVLTDCPGDAVRVSGQRSLDRMDWFMASEVPVSTTGSGRLLLRFDAGGLVPSYFRVWVTVVGEGQARCRIALTFDDPDKKTGDER